MFSGLSAMISGADNGSTVQVKNYTEQDAAKIFKDFFTWKINIFFDNFGSSLFCEP